MHAGPTHDQPQQNQSRNEPQGLPGAAFALGVPAPDDEFWWEPGTRLPDLAATLLAYKGTREAIFVARKSGCETNEGDGGDIGPGDYQRRSSVAVLKTAWEKLRDALDKA